MTAVEEVARFYKSARILDYTAHRSVVRSEFTEAAVELTNLLNAGFEYV
jgi:hypothetical protein